MEKDQLTFNDLPTVVGELCDRIASMESLLTEKLSKQYETLQNNTDRINYFVCILFFIASHHYLHLNGSDSRLYLVHQWESGLEHYPVN